MYPQDDRSVFLPLNEQPQYSVTGWALYSFSSSFLDLENDVIMVFWLYAWDDGTVLVEEQEERKIKVRNTTKFTIILNFIEGY